MTEVKINAQKTIGAWPRIEAYQDSTLRFAPPADFPAWWEAENGRAKLLREWITLDEVWDYRTDEYHWDFQIGVNLYKDDPNHHIYDWGSTVPSQTHIQEHLITYAAHADEVMLNIRRYERETLNGIVSLEKYEEVVEKVIEFYKDLIPNIRYIEPLNEVDYMSFGGIGVDHYYKLYKCIARAVKRLNEKHHYAMPIGIGGTAHNALMSKPWFWRQFLEALAADPDRMIDFYSYHDYRDDTNRMGEMYRMHCEWIKELGLPELPIIVDEYGWRTTGIWSDALKNASIDLEAMIRYAHIENLHFMPWCTYHNPSYQMSFTQFLDAGNGQYASTPNGNAMKVLHMLLENELSTEVKYDLPGTLRKKVIAAATEKDGNIAVLVVNPTDYPNEMKINIQEIAAPNVKITRYLVDATHNNILTGDFQLRLGPTSTCVEETGDVLTLNEVLQPWGFELICIEKEVNA